MSVKMSVSTFIITFKIVFVNYVYFQPQQNVTMGNHAKFWGKFLLKAGRRKFVLPNYV